MYSGIYHEVVDFTAAKVCVYCLNINYRYCNKNGIWVLRVFKTREFDNYLVKYKLLENNSKRGLHVC